MQGETNLNAAAKLYQAAFHSANREQQKSTFEHIL